MKELQDKDEILSMEMATEILKAPAEDVSELFSFFGRSCLHNLLQIREGEWLEEFKRLSALNLQTSIHII